MIKMELTLKAYNDKFVANGLFNVYPELLNETHSYLQILENSTNKIENLQKWFDIPISTGLNNEEYSLRWDVLKLIGHIKKNKIKSQIVGLNDSGIWSCPTELDKVKLAQMSNIPEIEIPIILAFHAGIQKYIVVDGNHRYHVAKNRGQKYINAFVLHPKDHISSLSPHARNLYIIHHNLVSLHLYAQLPSKLNLSINDNLEIGSLFPILNKKYSFTRFRNFKYRFIRKLRSA